MSEYRFIGDDDPHCEACNNVPVDGEERDRMIASGVCDRCALPIDKDFVPMTVTERMAKVRVKAAEHRSDTTQKADPVVVVRRADLRCLSSLAYNLSQELYRLSEDTHDPAYTGSDAPEHGNSDQPGNGDS